MHMGNLFDLYRQSQNVYGVKYLDPYSGQWNDVNRCPEWNYPKYMVYEQLGRMCHLLQDQSVPAHVHCDTHACTSGMYCDYYENNASYYHMWTADEVFMSGGSYIYPYYNWGDPLYYLMYLMNEATDHYADGLTNGDDNYDSNCPGLSQIISAEGVPTQASQINDANCRSMHDKLMPLAIRATAGLLYWFAKETNQIPSPQPFSVSITGTFEFDPSQALGSQSSPGGCIAVSAPTTYTVNGHRYGFSSWSDGINDNPRLVCSDAPLTATYKGIHLSGDASAFANNSQRKFVRTGTSTPWYHQVYTSLGQVWIEHSLDGVNWTLGNGGLPLDNGVGKLPSIDYNGDAVAVVFQEETGSTWQIVVETFYLNGGSYAKGIPANVWLDTSPYSNNVNPNITWKTRSDGTGVCAITWERGGIHYVYGRLGSLSFYEDTWGQLAGTDANSISASLSSVRIGQNQEPTWKIAWQQRIGSSYAFIKYAEFAFYYIGTWNFLWVMPTVQISSSSVMNNYQPSMTCDAGNNWYACWIGDVNGTGDPSAVRLIYTNKSLKGSNVYYMYGMNTMPRSCAINMSSAGGCYFAWSSSQSSYSNKFVDAGNTGIIKTLNTSGKDIQMCGGVLGEMRVSAYYPFSVPYYFAASDKFTAFLPKTSPNAVATERGCFIGKGDAHLYYSFGNILLNNTPVDFVDAPDSVRYDGLTKINAVLVSQPIRITPTSKFTFTEMSTSSDSLAFMSVLGDSGYVRYRIDLVDNVSGAVIGTVKNTKITKANQVEVTGTTYSLDTKNIGTRTVKAKITISTNLDSPDIALVKSYSETNVVAAASAQSISLQPATVVTDYSLEQNFPNPFNPSTQISYSIPKDGMVTLKIVDALGREVETLVNQAQTAGRYEVTFDGSRLASGVYFYRLVSGEKVITKKMLMVK